MTHTTPTAEPVNTCGRPWAACPSINPSHGHCTRCGAALSAPAARDGEPAQWLCAFWCESPRG